MNVRSGLSRFVFTITAQRVSLALLALVGSLPAAWAVDTNWNVAGPANWSVNTNWDTGNVPGAADNADIQNGGTAFVNSAVPNIDHFYVGRGGGSGTLQIQAGGSLTSQTNWSYLGEGAGSVGNLDISGGSLTVNNAQFRMGRAGGTANVTQSGGTLTVNNDALHVGDDGGSAIYTMTGGNLNATAGMRVSHWSGSNGQFTQSGTATVSASDLTVGQYNGSSGTYDADGGTLTVAGNVIVGESNTSVGTFNADGATISTGWFRLGAANGATGNFNMTAGSLTTNNNDFTVGDGGDGHATFTGGTLNTGAGNLRVAGWDDSVSDVTVSGGAALNVNNIVLSNSNAGLTSNGTITQNGGTVTATGNLSIAENQAGNVGTYNLNGGTLNIGGNITNPAGSSTLRINGGTLSMPAGGSITVDRFHVGSGATGAHSLTGSQTITANGGTDGAFTVGLSGGTGTFTHNTTGTSTVNGGGADGWASVARGGNSTGTFNMQAGTFNTNGDFNIGTDNNDVGIMNHSGGTVNQAGGTTLHVGRHGGSNGTYNFTGGNLNVNGGTQLGWGGTGTFNLDDTRPYSGAGNDVVRFIGGLTLGDQASGVGNLNVRGANAWVQGQAIIGNSGVGNLTVNDNFSVSLFETHDQTMIVGNNNGSVGAVTQSAVVESQVWAHQGLTLGNNAGSQGSYNLSGVGRLSVDDAELIIGNAGLGTFTMTGGTVDLNGETTTVGASSAGANTLSVQGGTFNGSWIRAGSGGGSVGHVNVSGTGVLNATELTLGDNGNGHGNFSGGTINVGLLTVGQWSSSNSDLAVSGTADVNVSGHMFVGRGGGGTTPTGVVTQTGGTVDVGNQLYLGAHDGGGEGAGTNGTYHLRGGTLTVTNNVVNGNGTGRLFVDGGTFSLTNANGNVNVDQLMVGSNGFTGNLTLAGNRSLTANGASDGAMNVGYAGGTGTFTYNSTNTSNAGNNSGADGWVSVARGGNSTGTFNMQAGTFNTNGDFNIGTDNNDVGIMNHSGGTVNQAGGTTLHIGRHGGSNGTYNFTGGNLNVNGGTQLGWGGTGTFNLDDTRPYTGTGNDVVRFIGGLTLGDQASGVGNLNVRGANAWVQGQAIIGNSGVGNLTVNDNFSQSLFETHDQTMIVGNNSGSVGTVTQSAAVHTLVQAHQGLTLGNNSGSQGSYNLSGPGNAQLTIQDDLFRIGNGGQGTLTQSGGTITVSGQGTWLGAAPTGSGVVNHSAGTHNTAWMAVGHSGTGDYNLSGTGVLNVTATEFAVGRTNGSFGTFDQTGGTVNVNAGWTVIGDQGGSTGVYNMSDGTLNAGPGGAGYTSLTIGRDSANNNQFNQTGGDVNVPDSVHIAFSTGTRGTYDISGGTLDVTNNLVVGVSGGTMADPARLNVSGTGVVTTGDLIVAQNAGSFGLVTQSGGIINVTNPTTYRVGNNGSGVPDSAGNGTVNQSNGATNVTGNMVLGDNPTTGPVANFYNLSGGTLQFGDTLTLGAGAHHQTNATPSTLTINADAAFNFTGGTLFDLSNINTANGNTGTFHQNGTTALWEIGQQDTGPAGLTTLNGNLLQTSGTIAFDVFGYDVNNTPWDTMDDMANNPIDLLIVNGDAQLGGTVDVDFIGVAPLFGDVFPLMKITGDAIIDPTFHIDGGFFRVVPDGMGNFTLQAIVPEPGSVAMWSLLALAAGGFAVRMRSRRRRG